MICLSAIAARRPLSPRDTAGRQLTILCAGMRIVLITPEFPPGTRAGGIGTHSATIAPALARRGHDVCVLTRGAPGLEERDGVRLERLDHRWLPNRPAEHLLSLRTIAAAARRFRPDVVQAPEWEAEGWWVGRFGRTPLVTRLATPTYLLEELNRRPSDSRARLVRALERDQARRSAAVYAPTRAILERVAADWRLDRARLERIPNPVSIEEIERAGAGEPPFDLPDRFIVFVGRIERRKGVAELAAALPRVLGANPDVHALLIGPDPGTEEGALTEGLRRSVEPVAERVRFVGELPREQALAVVARAELAVFPSLWESFGYVALEAMALGVPVVASRAGGLAELVEDGRTGWLVPPGDADALSEALLTRLAARSENRRVAETAKEEARSYDVEAVVDALLELYERASEGGFDASIYGRGYRRYFRADEATDPFHALYERKRAAVLAGLGHGSRRRVLDVGGGYGRLAAPLAERNDVTLVDVSEEMLAEARERCPPEVELVQADARELPFPDASFDVVLALDLLPHLPDARQALRELSRVARVGGQVVFDTTNALPLWVLAYPRYFGWRPKRLALTLLAGGVLPEWRPLVRHHRAADVRAAIGQAGLQLEQRERFGPRWCAKWHLWWTRRL
jgi:glycogen(starch) synthase